MGPKFLVAPESEEVSKKRKKKPHNDGVMSNRQPIRVKAETI